MLSKDEESVTIPKQDNKEQVSIATNITVEQVKSQKNVESQTKLAWNNKIILGGDNVFQAAIQLAPKHTLSMRVFPYDYFRSCYSMIPYEKLYCNDISRYSFSLAFEAFNKVEEHFSPQKFIYKPRYCAWCTCFCQTIINIVLLILGLIGDRGFLYALSVFSVISILAWCCQGLFEQGDQLSKLKERMEIIEKLVKAANNSIFISNGTQMKVGDQAAWLELHIVKPVHSQQILIDNEKANPDFCGDIGILGQNPPETPEDGNLEVLPKRRPSGNKRISVMMGQRDVIDKKRSISENSTQKSKELKEEIILGEPVKPADQDISGFALLDNFDNNADGMNEDNLKMSKKKKKSLKVLPVLPSLINNSGNQSIPMEANGSHFNSDDQTVIRAPVPNKLVSVETGDPMQLPILDIIQNKGDHNQVTVTNFNLNNQVNVHNSLNIANVFDKDNNNQNNVQGDLEDKTDHQLLEKTMVTSVNKDEMPKNIKRTSQYAKNEDIKDKDSKSEYNVNDSYNAPQDSTKKNSPFQPSIYESHMSKFSIDKRLSLNIAEEKNLPSKSLLSDKKGVHSLRVVSNKNKSEMGVFWLEKTNDNQNKVSKFGKEVIKIDGNKSGLEGATSKKSSKKEIEWGDNGEDLGCEFDSMSDGNWE